MAVSYTHLDVYKRQVKKKGKKTQSEITTSESAVKKQEEFEEMKKKTRNMMSVSYTHLDVYKRQD